MYCLAMLASGDGLEAADSFSEDIILRKDSAELK